MANSKKLEQGDEKKQKVEGSGKNSFSSRWWCMISTYRVILPLNISPKKLMNFICFIVCLLLQIPILPNYILVALLMEMFFIVFF